MIRHKQLYRHRPAEGVYGDCQRTVLACLLDLRPEDVPHFGYDGCADGVFADRVDLWLRTQGYALAKTMFPGETALEDVKRTQGYLNPGLYWMLSGRSRLGCNHVVVCLGDAVYHDTSLDDSGVVGPGSDGYYWVEWLVPLALTEKRSVGPELADTYWETEQGPGGLG